VKEQLLNVAEWWLDHNVPSEAWSSVWLLLEKEHNSVKRRSWLSGIAAVWLAQSRPKERDWPLVWCCTWDINKGDTTIQMDLARLANEWLGTHLSYEHWLAVWRRIWDFENNEEQRLSLQKTVDEWRSLHDLNEHAFRLMLDIPIHQ
jgi:hypothetical protein